MSFKYSLEHLDFSKILCKEDLLRLLKEHDYDSFIYSLRTAQLSVAMCKEMQLDDESTYMIFLCGIFHDIGKLGMSYEFLNFPNTYTIEMYEEMKKHPIGGAYLLEKVSAPIELIENSRHHHTNFDGTGYPGGLFSKEIPLQARITRISDSADAYLSKRCYKDGGPANETYQDLMQYSGTSYDPELLDVFGEVHKKVMKMCHKNGLDYPSQEVYMHYLNVLYHNDQFGNDALFDLIKKN